MYEHYTGDENTKKFEKRNKRERMQMNKVGSCTKSGDDQKSKSSNNPEREMLEKLK